MQVLNGLAVPAFGPADGALTPGSAHDVTCDSTGVTLHNFVAEARFYNPQPEQAGAASPQGWDYGIRFSNEGEETEYHVILDSSAKWALNLHSSGYDVENRDMTGLLDTSSSGSNSLKIFVTDGTVQLYINSHYIDTLDLDLLDQGTPEQASHTISICSGIRKGDSAAGRRVRYTGFAVSSLP